MSNSSVTIYHNPRCSKSRQTLSLLKEKNLKITIIQYLETPPSTQEIKQILALLNYSPRELMRVKETEYKENGLDDNGLSDTQLIQAMQQFPKLIERPIVLANGKAKIGRPPESVLEIV